ncbi:hypothetical protein [Polaribacter sp. SA4-12]|uniref:hypothetical protein n=1 Tax=Polaribacter sp. SA4-12 TaxID=1312072 RepID=UPI000B3C21AD|nr:hypothetical protein [Polaribacter sp. SA4-12]ARV15457.1 hypothetical protein BTO07_10030 [Polaribacter sp. SA4-12]
MKTIKKITLVALMLGTLIGYANEDKNTTDNKAKRTVKVEFKNVKKGQSLTIKNDQGTAVYNNEIKNSGRYSRIFDFSALEDGIYSAELNKDFEIIIKKFYVKNGLVTFLNNNSEKVFKPVIRTKDNLLYISKLDFNQEPLKVIIYYNGNVILSETLEGKEHLNRVYRLSENKVGNYKIILNTEDRTFVKGFTI